MSVSSTPGNETVTSSTSAETQSFVSPLDDMAIVLHEPQGSNGKTRLGKRKSGERNENNGALTSDSAAERETSGSPVELEPHESEGSKGKPRGRKGKNGTSSTSSIESGTPVLPSEDISVVPHDPDGTDGQKKRRNPKKRGRHFDREVRAHILQVCLHSLPTCFVRCIFCTNLSCVASVLAFCLCCINSAGALFIFDCFRFLGKNQYVRC